MTPAPCPHNFFFTISIVCIPAVNHTKAFSDPTIGRSVISGVMAWLAQICKKRKESRPTWMIFLGNIVNFVPNGNQRHSRSDIHPWPSRFVPSSWRCGNFSARDETEFWCRQGRVLSILEGQPRCPSGTVLIWEPKIKLSARRKTDQSQHTGQDCEIIVKEITPNFEYLVLFFLQCFYCDQLG